MKKKKKSIEDLVINHDDADTIHPDQSKMMLLKDMKRFNFTIERFMLRKYGFNEGEINWLEKHKKIQRTYKGDEDDE